MRQCNEEVPTGGRPVVPHTLIFFLHECGKETLAEREQRKARLARFMKYWQRDVATRQGRKKARRLDMGHSSRQVRLLKTRHCSYSSPLVVTEYVNRDQLLGGFCLYKKECRCETVAVSVLAKFNGKK